MTWIISFSHSLSLPSQCVVLIDRDETAVFKAVEKEDTRGGLGDGNDEDEPPEEFKGAVILNAEAKAKERLRCCWEAESPEDGEHSNTVVVVATAATAVDKIVLRFI